MSTRAEAIEAAIREFVKPRMHTNESHGKLRADLGAALDAALAVLHPTVPNTVEALDALPVGTVIRIDTRAYVHTAAWEWVETVTGTAYTADELDAEAVILGIVDEYGREHPIEEEAK